MKLFTAIVLLLLPSALCPLPSSALYINFDDGDYVYIDENDTIRHQGNVVYEQEIFIPSHSHKIKSTGNANCNKSEITLSFVEYYDLNDNFIQSDRHHIHQIQVKPNTMFAAILDTVCNIKNNEYIKQHQLILELF